MGVVLGTLTTKDGQVIPLPTAADVLDEPVVDEYRKEEEKRYAKCIRKPVTHGVWGTGENGRPVTRPVAMYSIKTENIKRQQGEMTMINNDKLYQSGSYRLFETYFKTPNAWLSSRDMSKVTGVGISSVSTLTTRTAEFLISEGLMKEKDDPHTAKGKLRMFVGQCEKPEEEARLWYAKMMASKKKKPAAKGDNPQPQAVSAPKTSNTVTPVQVDTGTMEAIVRVPLDKLASVLKLITS